MTASRRQSSRGGRRAALYRGNDFVRLFRRARRGVVFIRTLKENEPDEPEPFFPFFLPGEPEPKEVIVGIGTGIVLSKDGLVLTSEHVVNRPRKILVKLNKGTVCEGKVLWADPEQDIALLRIDKRAAASLSPLPLGSSRKSKVGEIVLSIGNPLGLENSITSGIISGKHRSVAMQDRRLSDIIQTDCAINPGSSGGPLINARGQVIGMNAFMAKNKNGLGFALGIDGIKERIRRYFPG
ncbi:trypsin-like peptidase domain-containing protein [Cohnella lubricantis]|uniref:Trypsin-like peptidase domain-containing protein n=1 Tax=Cohnella lubricantis TaxID=2163172 RepID=A0A841TIR1_9BACL|nr:trypsin-like peptidase domain-containing protein [Cohnella lubricantis]MBB6678381.1 trypsin-like peptidase domain-containing protein [Cohnella lubricantis]MBP2116761.1 serine protease Do [Cohnella lubricantis]